MSMLVRIKTRSDLDANSVGFLVPVKDFTQASEVVSKYIQDNSIPYELWYGGRVVDDQDHHLATVAFNGRVFNPKGDEINV